MLKLLLLTLDIRKLSSDLGEASGTKSKRYTRGNTTGKGYQRKAFREAVDRLYLVKRFVLVVKLVLFRLILLADDDTSCSSKSIRLPSSTDKASINVLSKSLPDSLFS